MKKIILTCGIVAACGLAFGSDIDLLKEGCNALQIPKKRLECNTAIEHIVSSKAVAPKADERKYLMVNFRAIDCEQFEFSELDSYGKNDLEAAICSFDAGDRFKEESSRLVVEKQVDPVVKTALLRQRLASMQRCQSERIKATQLFSRKFPEAGIDCSKMPGKFAPPKPEQKSDGG